MKERTKLEPWGMAVPDWKMGSTFPWETQTNRHVTRIASKGPL